MARTFRVDPGVFQDADAMVGAAEQLLARAAADVGALAARSRASSEPGDDGNGPDEAVIASLEIHGSAERAARIRGRLEAFLQELTLESNGAAAGAEAGDGATPHRLVLAWYPVGLSDD